MQNLYIIEMHWTGAMGVSWHYIVYTLTQLARIRTRANRAMMLAVLVYTSSLLIILISFNRSTFLTGRYKNCRRQYQEDMEKTGSSVEKHTWQAYENVDFVYVPSVRHSIWFNGFSVFCYDSNIKKIFISLIASTMFQKFVVRRALVFYKDYMYNLI